MWDGLRGEPLVRRWIGARRRRASRESRSERGADIIVLTWAQTFGRDVAPARPDRPQGAGSVRRIVDLGEEWPGG